MSRGRGTFDPVARKNRISEGWDSIAETWDSWAPVVEEWFAPATAALLELLELKSGDRVLELAAGTGGLTLHLARTVGPTGSVVATDIGPNMVKLAARNVRAAGLTNVVVRVMDGEAPDLAWASMDAVVCRQGFMFLVDPERALSGLCRILRPGGRIALTVFSSPERNGFMVTPLSILSRRAHPDSEPAPAAVRPGPFGLSEPGALESMMSRAGFVEVKTRLVSSPLRLPSVRELLRFDRDILGEDVTHLPKAEQEKAWQEVAEASLGYTGPNSPGAPCELIVAFGRRPAARSVPR